MIATAQEKNEQYWGYVLHRNLKITIPLPYYPIILIELTKTINLKYEIM